MKIFCITQARMGSTRLPGKVLKTINNKALIDYHVRRVALAKQIDHHIIATTSLDIDIPLVNHCKRLGYSTFCGNEKDVLDRYYKAALWAQAKPYDLIIRLTGDCPLVCPELIDSCIDNHKENSLVDYTHVSLDYYPRGFDVEIFSMKTLTEIHNKAKTAYEKEHVTPFIYQNPSRYNLNPIKTGKPEWSSLRLCVDEPLDFSLMTKVINYLGDNLEQATATRICQALNSEKFIFV